MEGEHDGSCTELCILDITSHIDVLVQERGNSSALAMVLHLSCTNPSICLAHNYSQRDILPFVIALYLLPSNHRL